MDPSSVNAKALDKYPSMLTIDMCKEIAGPLFDIDLFHSICFGEDRVSKHVFLSALDDRTVSAYIILYQPTHVISLIFIYRMCSYHMIGVQILELIIMLG